jgi:hypothetical protein
MALIRIGHEEHPMQFPLYFYAAHSLGELALLQPGARYLPARTVRS